MLLKVIVLCCVPLLSMILTNIVCAWLNVSDTTACLYSGLHCGYVFTVLLYEFGWLKPGIKRKIDTE